MGNITSFEWLYMRDVIQDLSTNVDSSTINTIKIMIMKCFFYIKKYVCFHFYAYVENEVEQQYIAYGVYTTKLKK